ncbi:hypothetical protein [Pseudobutyrivibrio sp. MD2005]|uniref:hypothetical protein n=1 Tax=Pseudobutyrivibrio sp. MD2005 TaxID=1410616 RepID=UPI00048918D3|nr:hypothetical protein [Pseudobutyrivibrio sp. MD2005]
MNIYIGDCIENVNINDKNIELSDDFLEFLFKNRSSICSKEYVLNEIDPYDDTIIEYQDLHRLLSMCKSVMESDILEKYEDMEDVNNFKGLVLLVKEAMQNHSNMIIIGD